jgi:hypothetical protein
MYNSFAIYYHVQTILSIINNVDPDSWNEMSLGYGDCAPAVALRGQLQPTAMLGHQLLLLLLK